MHSFIRRTRSGVTSLLNLHPDRLEFVNLGCLPVGVTPRNTPPSSRRRKDGHARVFHGLKPMDREGNGLYLLFELLFVSGRVALRLSTLGAS
jgi:ATP-dependent DNA helicase RecG